MRLTSDFFVSALTRRVFNEGGFAAIVRRGATEAGAVFVIARGRMGEAQLYGPAAQTAYGEEQPADRQFSLLGEGEDKIDARLAKETRFDPDVWVVELEPANLAIAELLSIAED